MNKSLWLTGIVFLLFFNAYSQKVNIGEKPRWVDSPELNFDQTRETESGEGYRYVIVEEHKNLALKSNFSRNAILLLSVDGIQENSDIQIDYDPSYQNLIFHEINIYRNGKKINKLAPEQIKFIQRESSSDRHIYDGTISALLHLSDVQKNDILEYSYSINGYNPVYGDDFSGFLNHKYYSKVEQFYFRLLVPKGKKLTINPVAHTYTPELIQKEGMDIYQWSHDGLETLSFDTNVPYWSFQYPVTSYSTFPDWNSVVNWALPLYEYSLFDAEKIGQNFSDTKENISRITNIIRYVQDDIRYLGLESGMSGYKPNQPMKVYNQKFGDCKDKSLLLVALLRNEGVEAYPVLVNTQWKDNIAAYHANAASFDHCVVTYNWDGETYFVDPTISDQGGNISHISFPDYKKGLVLKKGSSELVDIPTIGKSVQYVSEEFLVPDLSGKVSLTIQTEYRGKRADEIRSEFLNTTQDEISKNYLNFYSRMYPSIQSAAPIEFIDTDRNISNVVTTIEYYTIDNFWEKSEEDKGNLFAQIYPIELNSRLDFPVTAMRESDYYVGDVQEFTLNTRLIMPEYWPTNDDSKRIESDAFIYENEISGEGNIIEIKHKLEILKSSISGSEIPQLLKDKDKISAELGFMLTYADPESTPIDYEILLVGLLILILVTFLFFLVYKNFNPEPQGLKKHQGIGGWLILPAIGLVTKPLLTFFILIDGSYFSSITWQNAASFGTSFEIYMWVSFVFLITFFAYTILCNIFFFGLRTGAPYLYMILIGVNLGSVLLESYVVNQFFPELESPSSLKDITGAVIGAFIWLPYFVKSERVKSTFTKKFMAKNEPQKLQYIASSENLETNE